MESSAVGKPGSTYSMSVKSSKLKARQLDIFNTQNDSDDDDNHQKTSSLSQSNEGVNKEVLPDDVVDVITKTALWVVSNPDKVSILLENSKNNEKMKFLFEKESISGRFYHKELLRLQAQREVQSIW